MSLADQTKMARKRVGAALIVGVVVGAALSWGAAWAVSGLVNSSAGRPFLEPYFLLSVVGLALGAPIWFVLQRFNRQGGVDAALAGIAVPILGGVICIILVSTLFRSSSFFDVGGLLANRGTITHHGWTEALRKCAVFSLAGCLTASIMWQIAYRVRLPWS